MVETVNISVASAEPVEFRSTSTQPSFAGRRGAPVYRHVGKRVLDIAAILLAAPIVVPLIALLAIIVSLDGGRPFYRQTRVGRDGRCFRMLKLRTMVPGADEVLIEMIRNDPAVAREWDVHQKLQNDPRVTPIGRFLRRSSLDELPQLWNVIAGDMSLVGPRPIMDSQRDLYQGQAYYALRPGITGLWQVSARNAGFHTRVEYDHIYHEKLTLWQDLRLLIQTANVVVRGTGW